MLNSKRVVDVHSVSVWVVLEWKVLLLLAPVFSIRSAHYDSCLVLSLQKSYQIFWFSKFLNRLIVLKNVSYVTRVICFMLIIVNDDSLISCDFICVYRRPFRYLLLVVSIWEYVNTKMLTSIVNYDNITNLF